MKEPQSTMRKQRARRAVTVVVHVDNHTVEMPRSVFETSGLRSLVRAWLKPGAAFRDYRAAFMEGIGKGRKAVTKKPGVRGWPSKRGKWSKYIVKGRLGPAKGPRTVYSFLDMQLQPEGIPETLGMLGMLGAGGPLMGPELLTAQMLRDAGQVSGFTSKREIETHVSRVMADAAEEHGGPHGSGYRRAVRGDTRATLRRSLVPITAAYARQISKRIGIAPGSAKEAQFIESVASVAAK